MTLTQLLNQQERLIRQMKVEVNSNRIISADQLTAYTKSVALVVSTIEGDQSNAS